MIYVFHINTDVKKNGWFPSSDWPQLRRAPIKFGRFIKLYNINVKVLYKQTDMGFAAEAGFFLRGERGRFAQKKGETLHLQVTDFREKNPPQAQYVL